MNHKSMKGKPMRVTKMTDSNWIFRSLVEVDTGSPLGPTRVFCMFDEDPITLKEKLINSTFRSQITFSKGVTFIRYSESWKLHLRTPGMVEIAKMIDSDESIPAVLKGKNLHIFENRFLPIIASLFKAEL